MHYYIYTFIDNHLMFYTEDPELCGYLAWRWTPCVSKAYYTKNKDDAIHLVNTLKAINEHSYYCEIDSHLIK